jgi:hypothetical protein
MKCPTCGSLQFFAKDPEDAYEEYRFSIQGDRVIPDADVAEAFTVTDQTEAFCERCAWHGRLGELEK